jgi:hypothetical protein
VPYVNAAEQEADGEIRTSKPPGPATTAFAGPSPVTTSGTSVATSQKYELNFTPSLLSAGIARRWPLDDGGDQSGHDFAVAKDLADRGYSQATAAAAIRARRERLKSPSDRAKGNRADYVDRSVARAYEESVPGERPPASPVAFPLDALPPELAGFVREASRALQCAPEALVLPLLAALGAMIGNSRWIQLKPGWIEPALLWTVVVLASGKVKSPAFDLVLRPLQHFEAETREQHRLALRQYEREMTRYRAALRLWEKKPYGPMPDEPVRPACLRLQVSDTTIEGLFPILEENPRGVLLQRDELAGWFKSFDAYRQGQGGDCQHWLSIHRASAVTLDRKKDRESRHVPHAFVAITGGIQPATLRRVLTPEFFESGLVARLLLAWPTSPQRQWTEEGVPAEAIATLQGIYSRLRSLPMKATDSGSELEVVPLSPEAKLEWAPFYNAMTAAQSSLDEEDPFAAALAKFEGSAARLALIIAFATWAAGTSATAPESIDGAAMRAGIRIARWAAEESRRVYRVLAADEQDQRLRRLCDWIRAQSGGVTPRDLARGPRSYRDNPKGGASDLELLVRRGWVRKTPVRPRGGGIVTQLFELVPDSETPERGDARSEEPLSGNDLGERSSPEGDESEGAPP